jgi:hypothetical protein
MKKIVIKNLTKSDKSSVHTRQRKHCVFLGNDSSVYFSDMKKAKAFLVATNEFLNQKLFELNALYIDLFTEYRKSWFYFFNIYDRKMHITGENNVLMEISTIEKKMTLMVARAHFENGSSIVWHGFRVIISSMKNITGSLSYLYKTKKFYAQSHQIRAIEARIIILENQLNEWGSDLKPT